MTSWQNSTSADTFIANMPTSRAGDVSFSRDSSGNINGLIALSGILSLAPNNSSANTCCLLGDSITSYNMQPYTYAGVAQSTLHPYNDTQANGIGYSQHMARGFFTWLNILSGNSFLPLYNGGNSGERSDAILARVPTVLTYAPRWIFELSGTNDISQLSTYAPFNNNQTTCENAIFSNRTAIWSACKASGVQVVALAITPCRTTSSFYSSTQMSIMQRVNRRLKNYAQANGIYWCDTYTALVDTTNINGYGLDAYFDTTSIHPWSSGSYQMAKAIWNQIKNFIQPYTGLVSSIADSYVYDPLSRNIMPGADSILGSASTAATGTGFTGFVPVATAGNLWVAQRAAGSTNTGVASVVAAPDGVGYSFHTVLTSAAAEDGFQIIWVDATPSITKLPAGTQVYFECAIKITGMTNFKGINAGMSITVVGGANAGGYSYYNTACTSVSNEGGITDATGFTGVIRSPAFNIPNDATGLSSIRTGIIPTFSGAGGATIDMWRCSIVKV